MSIMNELLHHLLTVAISFIVALPPGCCTAFDRLEAVKSVPVNKVSCCSHGVPAESGPGSKSLPIQSDHGCCCVRDATLVQKMIPVASMDAVVVQTPAHWVIRHSDQLPLNVNVPSIVRATPDLQILMCVWLC